MNADHLNSQKPTTQAKLKLNATERFAVLQCLLLSVGMALLVLSVPLFMLQLYDRILPSQNTDTLIVLTVLAVAALALYGMLDHLRGRISMRVGTALELRAMQHAPLQAMGNGDLDRFRLAIQSGGLSALFDLPSLPIWLLFLGLLHPMLALLALVSMLILVFVSAFGAKRSLLMPQARQPLDSVLDGSERLWLSPLQSTALEKLTDRRAGQRLDDLTDLDRRGRVSSTLKSLRLMTQIICLALGGYLAMIGVLAPAAIVAATILMSRALAPIEQLAGSWPVLLEGRRAWARMTGFAAENPDQSGMPIQNGPEIHIQGAVITPPGTERPILRAIDLKLLPGTFLGVVGVAGSGKTALLNAMIGRWPLRFGRIQIDGRNPRQLLPNEHLQAFGYVGQERTLIAGTIAENIAGFRRDADATAIVTAARAAGIHKLILAQVDGYGRDVGIKGSYLTSDLRFGVALAAALYQAPPILILDAPFDGLDMAASNRLHSVLAAWASPERTIIISAHRLEDVRHASHLLVLGEGRVQAGGAMSDVVAWLQNRQAADASRQVGSPKTVAFQGQPNQGHMKQVAANQQHQLPNRTISQKSASQ